MTETSARRFVIASRRVCLAALCALLAFVSSSHVSSQGGQTITSYQLVSETPLTRSTSEFIYRARLTNTAGALSSATATGTARNSAQITFTDNSVTFGPVGAGGSVLSTDTFTFVGKRKADPIDITWTIVPVPNRAPAANAGPDQTRYVTQTAQLDGSASTDPDGNALGYAWSFVSRPAGSVAALSNPLAVMPTFVVDRPGSYVVRLIVNDGFVNSTADEVTISTLNSAPVANAGPDQTVFVAQPVTLNGSASSDVDGDRLSFAWTFASRPPGSTATLTNPASIMPTFVPDVPGTYVVSLIVNDGVVTSAPDAVSITTQNSAPVANAGPDQTVSSGSTVTLDGSGSTDVDGDPLTYAWSLTSIPAGSTAVLNNPAATRPTFAVDRPGRYVAQLIVRDGTTSSTASTVTITTLNSRPVANAGVDQSARVGGLVVLDGSASSDADGDPLSFRWSLTSAPAGSTAALAGADSVSPSFVVDRSGTYLVQLIVNDGHVDSAPDTLTISTTNTAPIANAGTDQLGVPVGTAVTLDGTQSSDPDNQGLTYSWSLIARPAGSSATLSDATTALPTFTPDVSGDYTAQLIVNDGSVDSAPDTVRVTAVVPPSAPTVTLHPIDLTVIAGQTASFTAAAIGNPLPTVRWQVSADGGASFTDYPGATSSTLSFVTVPADDGKHYRALFSNAIGEVATSAATLTVTVNSTDETVRINDEVVINGAPMLAPLVDRTVDVGAQVTFTAAATDPGDTFVFSLLNAPAGASIDPATGVFTWTPTTAQSGRDAVITVVVTDSAGLSASRNVTITVRTFVLTVDESVTISDDVVVNGAPLLGPLVDQTVDAETPVTFTAAAVDPGDTTIFSLINAPAGATIDPLTGVFSWTPTAAQSPGTFAITVVVTDSRGLFATRVVTIVVRQFVHAIDERVTINDDVTINGAPMLAALVDRTVDVGTPVTFTATAIDPGDTLTFSLLNAPPGASIDPVTGVFTWTPATTQGARDHVLTVVVTDSGGLSATRTITITVRPFINALDETVTVIDDVVINGAPLLGPLVDQTVDAETPVTFTATAVDPGDTLVFSLINTPAGATIDPLTGAFSWTPTAAQSPGTFAITVVVTDSHGLFATRIVVITVRQFVHAVDESVTITDDVTINGRPMLQPIASQTVSVGTMVAFRASAIDPGDTLVFSLLGAPNGATIDAQSGVFFWAAADPGGHLFFVRVTDSGGLFDDYPVTITVTPAVALPVVNIMAIDGSAAEWSTADTASFRVSRSGDLTYPLVVQLVSLGTARVGSDFDLSPNSGTFVVIDAGQDFADVTATTIDDGISEGIEEISVGVMPSSAYTIGFAPIATATIDEDDLLVTNTDDSGPGSLRQALLDANRHSGIVDTIRFDIPGTGLHTIAPFSELPAIAETTIIDGTTQPGYQPPDPAIEISGVNLGPTVRGFVLIGDNSSIRGLMIDQFGAGGNGTGIVVIAGTGNTFWWNEIWGNGGLGIDLGGDSVTPNDPDDSDTGPNDLQNFPVLTSALSSNGTTTLQGTITSRGNTGLDVQFFWSEVCDPTGYGQGHHLVAVTSLTTDVNGQAAFDLAIPNDLGLGQFITATATSASGTSEFSACFEVNARVELAPASLSLLTRDSASLDVVLTRPAGPGDVLVTLNSSDANIASVPATATIASGATSTTVNVTTGTTAGTALITATANQFNSGSSQVTVNLRSLSLSSASPFVGVLRTIGGTINLAQPAPTGGVTITLASSDPSVVSVAPSTVTIAAGGQTAAFTVTGVTIGTATISAGADGFATATLPISSTATSLITLGSGTVAPGLDTSLALSIGIPAPTGGVTIAFTSSNPAVVSVVTPTVFIPEGAQIPAANPIVRGVTIGSAQITASTTTLAPDTASVTVTLSIDLSPNTFDVIQSTTGSLTLLTSAPAPAGGLTFNTSVDNASIATVPSTVHVAAGETSVPVPVTGVAVGSTTVRASAPGIGETTAVVDVTPAPPISVGDATIGKDLEVQLGGQLGAPAPAGNVQVTVTSLDPARVLLATSATDAGTASLTLQVNAGQTTIPAFYVQALDGSGTVQLQTTAPGYAADASTITLTPSGFAFGLGTSPTLTTTSFSGNTSLSVSADRLNADLTIAGPQALRGGLTVNVPIASSNPVIGTIVDSVNDQLLIDHLVFTGGDSSAAAEFDPREGGTTTIALGTPAGFNTPPTLQQIVATVTAPAINVGDATIGKDLEVSIGGALGAPAPAGNVQVTITSLEPTRVLLAASATAVGTDTLTFQVNAGQTGIPNFYVQALDGSSTAELRTTAPGYSTDTSTITLTPSGFAFALGTLPTLTTTSLSTNTSFGVVAMRLNADLSVAGSQALRGGVTVSVPISSSNSLVGTIVESVNDPATIDHLAFTAGTSSASFEFDPIGGGTTTIALGTPAGYSTPTTLQQVVATVTAPAINVGNQTVGKDLEVTLSGALAAPAPAGNVQVTITSLEPTRVLLATAATDPGIASLTFQINAGQTSIPNFYVQALDGSGTAQLRITAPGYSTDTSTITMTPSAFAFQPGTVNFNTTTFSGNTSLGVVSARLDPVTLNVAGAQALRGGVSTITVSITNSDPNVGTIVDGTGASLSTLTFNAGDSTKSFAFDPAAGGTTTIGVAPPAGFSTPNTLRQISASVTAPNVTFNQSSVLVGLDLQTSVTISLGVSPPSRLTVTATSNSSSVATISTDPTAAGTATLTFNNVPASLPGTTIGTIYIQGRSLGTTTLTVQAPGYNDGTLTVTVHPSGFSFQPGTTNISTTTFSNNSSMNIQSVRLDPTTLNVAGAQPLRGGHSPVSIDVTSATPTVGTIVGSPVVFNANESSKSVQFDPANGGTTTLGIPTPPPAGFSTPSNLQQITATVTAPNVTFSLSAVQVGLDLQASVTAAFSISPPTRRDVTVTNSNPAIATITTNPLVEGGATLTFTNAPTTFPGGTSIGTIYVQGRSLGTTTLTIQSPGYNDDTMTVTVHPSGFSFQPGTSNISTTTFSGNSSMNIQPVRLDPTTLNVAAAQALRGGHGPVSIDITSATPSVGTIVGSPVVFNANDLTKSIQFDPANSGTTTLAIPAPPPAGFSTPSNLQQITATVTAPDVTFSLASVQIGLDLQASVTAAFSISPPTRRDVTVTSSNPAIATITTNPVVEGGATLTFTNAPTTLPGTSIGTIYVQGRSLGTTTLTIQSPGYNDDTMTVTVHPSGFSFQPGTANFSTTAGAANRTLNIQPVRLDPVFLNVAGAQALRGGHSPVTVSVTSSNPAVGTIVGSPVTFNPNDSSKSIQFDPAAAGTATIAIPTPPPAGFTLPSNLQQIIATITP